MDRELIAEAAAALERKEPVVLSKHATNLQRTLGTMLSYEVWWDARRNIRAPAVSVHCFFVF